MDETGVVRGITIGPRLEMSLLGLFTPRPNQSLSDDAHARTRSARCSASSIRWRARRLVEGRPLPLLAPPSLRVGLRRLIEPVLPNLPVVSLAELPPFVNLTTVALWEMKEARLAAA